MGVPLKQIVPIAEYNNNKEKKVRDLMKPLESYSSVSSDTTIKNAIYILKNSIAAVQNSNPNYLMVFENKSLVGFVGIQELFASIQPPNLRDDWYRGWNVSGWAAEPTFMQGLFTSLCLDVAEKPVRDIMEPVTTAVNTDSTLEEAVFKFFKEKRDMFPVVENERLVGVLTSGDLFAEMVNIIS